MDKRTIRRTAWKHNAFADAVECKGIKAISTQQYIRRNKLEIYMNINAITQP